MGVIVLTFFPQTQKKSLVVVSSPWCKKPHLRDLKRLFKHTFVT